MLQIDEPIASWLMLIARISLASVFLVSGIHKSIWYSKAVDEFRRDRVPLIWLTLPATIGLHLVGSTCLILGYRTTEAAVALAIFTIAATLIVHPFWRLPKAEQLDRSRIANANLAVFGGLVLLAVTGPGSIVV